MWRKLKNLFLSLKTYHALSPSLGVRYQVNRTLLERPALTTTEWFEKLWQPYGVSVEVAVFVYTYLAKYSGLQFGRVLPSDRLDEDLRWSLVCWFDWNETLCKDFWNYFGIRIQDQFELFTISTVEELVLFLDHQVSSIHRRHC